MPFFLIGYMGCGKSTIGKKVSDRLGIPFLDLDLLIEKEIGMNISDIFSKKGEGFFREKEKYVLNNYVFKSNVIVAVGGGTPCFYNNHSFMKAKGITIQLKVSTDELVNRLQLDDKRPLLFNNKLNLKDFVISNLSMREKEYMKSHYIIESDNISINDICKVINM